MIEIKACPICGRYPQIKRDYGYECCGLGAWCTIQCKPFLRKPHLKIEEGKSTWDRALQYAVRRWNEAVLEDLNTKRLHHVKVPENLVVIDFDLKDGKGIHLHLKGAENE